MYLQPEGESHISVDWVYPKNHIGSMHRNKYPFLSLISWKIQSRKIAPTGAYGNPVSVFGSKLQRERWLQ